MPTVRATVSALLCFGSTAVAQPAPVTPSATPASTSRVDEARRLIAEGVRCFRANDYAGAVRAFSSANAAVPRLENINKAASDLVAMKGQLPAALKEGLVSATKDYAPKFQEMVQKAYAIPGVQAIIEPKINQLARTFESFVQ